MCFCIKMGVFCVKMGVFCVNLGVFGCFWVFLRKKAFFAKSLRFLAKSALLKLTLIFGEVFWGVEIGVKY